MPFLSHLEPYGDIWSRLEPFHAICHLGPFEVITIEVEHVQDFQFFRLAL